VLSITTPANTTLTASGGEPKDFISTKCSFFKSRTLSRVASSYSFASETVSSAFFANALASLAYFVASISSLATYFWVISASSFSILRCSIIFSVSICACSSSGYICSSTIFISSTALLAAFSLSRPFFNLKMDVLRSLRFSSTIYLYKFNSSK
jgi:hypothetical protein